MAIVFVGEQIYPSLEQELLKQHKVLKIKATEHLYKGIKDHSDLHVHSLEGIVYLSQECAGDLLPHLTSMNIPCVTIKKTLGNAYPQTVPLNLVTTRTLAIHNFEHTAPEILNTLSKTRRKLIHVKQGYTRCTLLPLSSDCFLTSDKGIYKRLKKESIQIDYIENGPIRLPHQPDGFFPGCCGVIENVLYINGDLTCHPSADTIQQRCHDLSLTIVDVPGKPLQDIGSIIAHEGVLK